LGILIIVHEFGHLVIAKRCGVKVERFSIGFGPRLWSVKRGGTDYQVSLIPLGGYVKMAGESYEDEIKGERWEFLSQPPGNRLRIVIAGPLLNYALAFIIFTLIFIIGAPALSTTIGELLEGYPAVKAGLRQGDKIVTVDGKPVTYWEDMTSIIHKKFDEDVMLAVERDGKQFMVSLRPQTKEMENIFGQKIRVALIGISPSVDDVLIMRFNPVMAVYHGARRLFMLTGFTYKALWMMATGAMSPKEATGPIGIFFLTSQAAKLGFIALLHFMAVISFNLAIFNLLPLPILDGGHVLFLTIEKIRKKPLSQRAQEAITKVGLAFLLFLVVAVSYNDLIRYGVFEKVKNLFIK
jgi:regulator of sigma E protease